MLPQIGPKTSFSNVQLMSNKANMSRKHILNEQARNLTNQSSQASLYSKLTIESGIRDRFEDNKKIFMPGQVSTDNAGKHSPTFSVYNTLDSYKKIAAYDKQFQSPTFAFGKQKRPIGHHGKGHLRSILPGPGAYDTTTSDFPKMEGAH